jgi:hypothetical protein
MPDNTSTAFQELVRILEEAVRAGVNSVGLEYKGRDLMVFHNVGNIGLGASRISQELQQAVIEELVKRAGLSRKSKGKMQVSLLGKDYEAVVEEYDSFGESAFTITLKERKTKANGGAMSRKKKKQPAQPAPMRWEFDPDIPTHDFFESGSLDDMWNLQEAVDSFVHWLEEDRFLTWEAVACEEQGIRLTPRQKKALGSLLNFNDEEDDAILYIDEIPRPSEPWHIILNKIVPYLLIEPYRTFDMHEEVKCDGWNQIVTALKEHGQGLSLPPGVHSCVEVVPAELRHKLWLQFCFNNLGGLGQEKEMTLEDPEELYRIDWFMESLRECKESVAFFGLTLASLLTRVILPEKDQPIFLKLMQEKLGLSSAQEQIAIRL